MKPRQVSLAAVFSMVLALGILSLYPGQAWAQTGDGSVTGTVRDTSKGIVVGADVSIVETETNIAHKTQSNADGIYFLGHLPRGPYKLTVERTGFKTWEGTLTLEVGQDAVVDPLMQVGDTKTVVEVTGVAPVITRESTEVADVKDARRIEQLPLDGRFVDKLFTLTPGVEGGASARVNGLKVGSLEITLDGVSQVDRFGGGMLRVEPGLDTIQEFRIETTGSDARYSQPANVTLVSKSGTNQLHGDVFETHRNNFGGLQVRSRQNTTGTAPAKLIRNEFGGSVGGPIAVPHVYNGRNKSFFFASYEGSRARESESTTQEGYTHVPTDAMWNGDLSGDTDGCGNPVKIYDPLTTDANGQRQQFPGNIIPANRISAFAKELASLTARPTNNANPYTGSNFLHDYPSNTDYNYLTVKGDQKISDKDSLTVRWTRDTRNNTLAGGHFGDPATPASGFGTGQHNTKINDVAVIYDRSITNALLSQLLIGVDRSNHHQGTLGDFTNWSDKLGLPNPLGATGWPTLCANCVFCWDADNKIQQALTNVTIDEVMTWVKGKHTIEFGGKARKEWNNVRELQQAQGSDSFGGGWTSLFCPNGQPGFSGGPANVPFTGDGGFADLLLGLPQTLRNHFNHGYFYFRQTQGDLFINDKWKVSPRLTLTLGLRWEKWTPYTEKYNRITAVDVNSLFTPGRNGIPVFQVVTPGNHDIHSLPGVPPSVVPSWTARGLTYTTASAAGYPSSLFTPVNRDFGPRLGAAYMINNKTVLRGGYGEFFWPMPLSQILQAIRVNPPLDLRYTRHLDDELTAGGNDFLNYTYVSSPAPYDFVGKAPNDISGVFSIGQQAQQAFIWDGRHWKDSHARSWNVTLEREVMPNTLLRLSYVGTHGLDLEQQNAINGQEAVINYVNRTKLSTPTRSCTDPNFTNLGCGADLLRANPNWTLNELSHTGYSNTNSAQIEIERKFSSGLGLQWFYVYTRALNTTDAGGFQNGGVGFNNDGNSTNGTGGGQVPEAINILGEPNLSYAQLLRQVYFNSVNIPPHKIGYNGVADLPFGRGRRFGKDASGALNLLIGGWQFATIGEWNSGPWETVSASRWQSGNPRLSKGQRLTMDIFGAHQRLWFKGDFNPALAKNVSGGDLFSLVPANPADRVVHQLGPDCGGKFINRIAITLANGKCFNASTSNLYNYSPRGSIIGPGAWNTDMSLFKNFTFKERYQARFTADFFNSFNHPIDQAPNITTGLQNLSIQTNTPRTIQFSVRIKW